MARFSLTSFLAVCAVPVFGHPHLQLRQPIGSLDSDPALEPRARLVNKPAGLSASL